MTVMNYNHWIKQESIINKYFDNKPKQDSFSYITLTVG